MSSLAPLSRSAAAFRREDERARHVLGTIALLGAGVHALIGATFLALGVRWLAAFNILSVLTFLGALGLVRRGHILLPSVVALAEVVVHQTLAVSAMGWFYGFQYWLVPAAAAAFVTPGTRFRQGMGAMVVALAAYAALFALFGTSGRLREPTGVGWALVIVNHLGAPLVTCLIVHTLVGVSNDVEERLEAEHDRSEKLLHAILPAAVAERLKDGRTTSEGIDPATVLFADLVGFTRWAERTTPENVVRTLDTIFGAFDEMAERLGLEKIKTIGDAYMVAGGLPGTRPDHLRAIAQLALEMRAHLAAHGEGLSMRIGIHAGPVVAGVIGKRKFAFDLWGDTVNTAARMESHGLPGRIHVSDVVALALAPDFVIEERGLIDVKGKGSMRTAWLEGARSPRRG